MVHSMPPADRGRVGEDVRDRSLDAPPVGRRVPRSAAQARPRALTRYSSVPPTLERHGASEGPPVRIDHLPAVLQSGFPLDGCGDAFLRAARPGPRQRLRLQQRDWRLPPAVKSHRAIDPHTSNADAKSHTHKSITAPAMIAMSVAFAHAVKDAHHSSTSAASHQAAEQRAAPARRFARTILLHMCVLK
jgi:hypothetical protein